MLAAGGRVHADVVHVKRADAGGVVAVPVLVYAERVAQHALACVRVVHVCRLHRHEDGGTVVAEDLAQLVCGVLGGVPHEEVWPPVRMHVAHLDEQVQNLRDVCVRCAPDVHALLLSCASCACVASVCAATTARAAPPTVPSTCCVRMALSPRAPARSERNRRAPACCPGGRCTSGCPCRWRARPACART